jgi:hypothetical protein
MLHAVLWEGFAGLTHTHVHWILGRGDRGDIEIVGIAEANRAPDDLSFLELNLVVMEILDAAMESARTGRRVGLGAR